MEAQLLVDAKNLLGEGALWHGLRNSFMWVDIEGKKIFEYEFINRTVHQWEIGLHVSLIIETENPDMVKLAVQGGIVQYHLITHVMEWETEVEKQNSNIRTNDGSVDPLGRIWIGTMALDAAPKQGALYCIAKDNELHKKIAYASIPNGMVWDQKVSKLYFIDSASYQVAAYDFDLSTGEIGFDRFVISIPQNFGMPDGMCQDSEGMLWIAIWGGGGVYRYNPITGAQLDIIHVPAPNVTSCVFDGTENQIFITTARVDMSEEQLIKYPLSGGVFKYDFQ